MAHALRYYKELTQPDGTVIRLEIHKKNSTHPTVEIGRVLQALHLDIQGGADTIDAPIVKTSLTMTFVDAPDLEKGKKCGNWEEFYTPDSTMWKVVLKADGKTIWGGYVTPDSYQEDLRYRGSVTIIARDNIGHMQDFPFDMEGNADGMVTLEQLVNEAWAKIESPMRLDWWHEEQEAMYLMCEGNDAPSTYMNVSAFEDMSYFDAVEKALYSYGLVMRYTGSNRVTIMSLRDLPYQGKSSAPRAIEPIFLAHAQRELAPAVRRIEETVKYEDVDAVQPQVKPSDFSGVSDRYAYEFGHPNGATLETAPVHNIINTDERNGWANMPGKTLFFNAGLYELSNFDKIQPYADIMHRYMYIAVNNVQNISLDNVERFVSYGRNMLYQDFGFSLNLGILIEWSGALVLSKVTGYTLSGITYAVGCEYEGDIIYYAGDGKWQDSVCEITQEISGNEENNTIDIPVLVDRTKSYKTATFILYIRRISYTRQGDLASGRGLYAAVQSLSITHNNALLSDNTVNTVYNNDNNVILTRDPEFGPAYNTVTLPQIIKNGIFVKSGGAYHPAKGWAWSGGTPQQMAVYNHLQLLCYHSKPNNIISGDIAYADFVNMEAIYEWGGANHLLVSGSYNFLNGRIESAVLREFKFYNEMWSDVSGTSLPDTEQNNRTTAESGSGTSKASTYSNATTVNIGETSGGSGVTTLIGLEDTSINNQFTGQSLVYDTVAGKWINKVIGVGGSAFTHRGHGYSYDYNRYYEDPNLDATDFIRVGKILKGRMFLGGTSYPNYSIIFFDKDKNIITRYLGDEGKARVQNFELTTQIPSKAVYFVATNYNAHRAESYIELDSYLYVGVVNQIEKAVADVPTIKTNIGDNIAEKATVLSTKQLSMGIKCEAGNVRFKVSLLSGSLPFGWNLYRYVDGKFNETRLANEVPFGQAVDITVPEGDDGVWLFIFQGSADAMVEYEVTTGVNRSIVYLTENVVQQGNDIVEIQNDLLDIIGDLGSEIRKSSKNRIALWVDNTPDLAEYEFRISSDNPATSKYNLYYASADHSSLSLMNRDIAMGTWVEVNRDSAKPSLYIYDAGTADGATSEREYLIEFRATESLAKDVDDLKKRENSAESWKGKTIVCFGDSLTEFKDYDNNKTYADYIHDLTNAEVINIGIGGTQFRQRATPVSVPTNQKEAYAALDIVNMVKACCNKDFTKQIAATNYLTSNNIDRNDEIIARMQTIDWSKVDIVTIFAGTNDWNNSNITSFGELTSTDINTTFGAIKEIIRLLLTTYPHIHIYWFSPTVRWLTDDSGSRTDATWSDVFERFGYTLEEFSDAILSVVKQFHLPMCDMYHTLGWNQYNFSQFFSETDGVHPRVGEGTIQIAKKMIAFINSNKTF